MNQFVNFRFGLSFKQDSSIFVLLKYSINKPLKPEVIFKKQHYTLDFLLIAQSIGAQETSNWFVLVHFCAFFSDDSAVFIQTLQCQYFNSLLSRNSITDLSNSSLTMDRTWQWLLILLLILSIQLPTCFSWRRRRRSKPPVSHENRSDCFNYFPAEFIPVTRIPPVQGKDFPVTLATFYKDVC